tara:strand:- start:536 stop:1246 length:711 start_codon:yes stop_codon:yes gene_type:complete
MMSGAQLNYSSALSLFYNPALQSESVRGDLGVGNTLYYPNSGIYDLELALSIKRKHSTLGFGLSQEGFDQFNTTTGLLQYALELDSTWSIGITSGISTSNFYVNSLNLPNFSLGVIKELTGQLKMTLCLFAKQTYLVQENFKKGFHYKWKTGFLYESLNKQFTAHLSGQYERRLAVALCLYYRISKQFHFFVSGRSSPVDYTLGARMKVKSLAVLVGFQYHASLGFSPSSIAEYAF